MKTPRKMTSVMVVTIVLGFLFVLGFTCRRWKQIDTRNKERKLNPSDLLCDVI